MNGPSYYVIGDNGAKYGPADVDTLRKWAGEGRVQPTTRLEEIPSGFVVSASTVIDFFGQSYAQPPTMGHREYPTAPIQINSHLTEAILVALLCCQICGIVGIVFAIMADSAAKEGNRITAEQNAKTAQTWVMVGFIGGLAVYLLAFLFFVIGATAGHR